MLRTVFLVLALVLFPFVAARGETPQAEESPSSSQPLATQPALLSFGAAYMGFDKHNSMWSQGGEDRTRGTDLRAEYRFEDVLYSAEGDWSDFGIHPLAGIEGSSQQQLYGFGGLDFDWLLWKHLVLTESEAVGLFDSGDAKPLGSVIEFRSQGELGWRFDNNMRVTAFAAHISNAGITRHNPGEEMAGGYIHIPVCLLFGG